MPTTSQQRATGSDFAMCNSLRPTDVPRLECKPPGRGATAAWCIAACAVALSAGCLPRHRPAGQRTAPDAIAPVVGRTEPPIGSVTGARSGSASIPAHGESAPEANAPPDPNSPAATWNRLVDQARQSIEADDLDAARQQLTKLDQLKVAVTAKQSEQLAAVRVELENRGRDKRLRAAVNTLAADDRDEVVAAQERLFQQPAAALPLLREAAGDEDPRLVRGALEMLRRLRQPDVALPIMVSVLERPEQESNWPDAAREIELLAAPGAGPPLLELAVASELPPQRTAALAALATVVDPPPETLVALLPILHRDGPELATACLAAQHAVTTHGQHDILTGRGFDLPLTPQQQDQLAALPARLSTILNADSSGDVQDLVRSAKMLAIATRQVTAEPIGGIRIVAYGGSMADSQVAAVLDGQWNTVDPKLMWRHPVSAQGTLVVDLGRPRTVAGVRVWNLNEKDGSHRGWKEVTIFVGETTQALATPVAKGIVPEAPGVADPPDYSTTIPVGCVRGRYVRLRAESVWRADGYAGLTEVQVLGW